MGDGLKASDTIYFSYDGYIVAKTIFTGEIKTNPNRDMTFIYGHKLSDIKIIDSNIKLDAKIVSTRTIYVTKSIQDEIDRVMK